MKEDIETYELIDKFLRGEASASESELFNKKLDSDPDFRNEFEMQRLIHELVIEKSLLDIKRKVAADLNRKTFSITKNIILPVGVVLVGYCVYYFLGNKEKTISPVVIPAEKKNFTRSEIKERSIVTDAAEIKTEKKAGKSQISVSSGKTEAGSAVAGSKVTDNQTISAERIEPDGKSTVNVPSEDITPVPDGSSHPAPCPVILFDTEIKLSCRGTSTGSIVIKKEGITGGKPPYKYSINQSFGTSSAFYQLDKGKYILKVIDQNGCIAEKAAEVEEKLCTENKDYSFNPQTENWQFPFSEEENGTITISDKTGKVVFSADIQNGHPAEWNGKGLNGEVLETGTYLYIARPEKGELRQGYILILR